MRVSRSSSISVLVSKPFTKWTNAEVITIKRSGPVSKPPGSPFSHYYTTRLTRLDYVLAFRSGKGSLVYTKRPAWPYRGHACICAIHLPMPSYCLTCLPGPLFTPAHSQSGLGFEKIVGLIDDESELSGAPFLQSNVSSRDSQTR